LLVFPADAATISWTNVSGGDWSAAANWSPNQVPGGSDDAFITNTGTYAVTLDANPAVNSLTLGGASGQQTLSTAGYTLTLNSASAVNTNGNLALNGGAVSGGLLTVNGLLNWTGGQINGGLALSVTANGVMVVAGGNGNPDLYVEGVITNAGTLQLVSGTLDLYSCSGAPGELVNLPGGVVDITADVPITYGCSGQFVNLGTVVKSAGTGASILYPSFINSGTVEANSGAISIEGNATFNGGSLFIGTGQTLLSGGTTTLNGSLTSSNLVLAGANLAGTAMLTGVWTWTAGQILSSANLTLVSNSLLVVAGGNGNPNMYAEGIITNAGTIQLQSGTLELWSCGGGGELINLPGGVVDLMTDVSIAIGCNGQFVNLGTLVKSGGTATSDIQPAFINSGTVEANTGVISIDNNAALNAGSLFIGTGQTLLSGGTTTLNGSLTSSNLVVEGANLGGTAMLTGVWTWTAGQILYTANLTLVSNSLLVVAGGNGNPDMYVAGIITNAGTIQLQSGTLDLWSCGGGGELINLPGGVMDIMADVSIANGCSGQLVNLGTLVKSGGTGTSGIQPYFNNSGTVAVNSGIINFNGDGPTLNAGSQLIGPGQITLSANTATLNGSVTGSNLVLAGANLAGNGLLNGALTWTAGQINTGAILTVAANSVLVVAGGSGNPSMYVAGIITNAGTIQLQSGTLDLWSCGGGGELINLPGGVVDFMTDVSIANGCSGDFVNQGTVVKSGGTNTSSITSTFNNAGGSVGVESGTLSLDGNNFAQSGGTFFVTVGGTNTGHSGELAGVNSASLAGLLTVNLANGFAPSPGSAFQILSFSSGSGVLGPLNVPSGISVSYSNNGVYLTVTNTVALAPAITVQPTNVIVPYAASASFTVAATGMTPLNYVWTFDGAPLSDGGPVSGSATANLALNGVTDDNAGSYAVVITNAYGSLTSAVATLTVLNCTAPSPGLVAWWPGNGNALDIVGGNNGALANGVTFAPGEVGQAFSFNGIGQSVVIPDSPSLELTNTFTIEAWVNLATLTDDPNGNGRGIVSKVGGVGGNNGYQFALGGGYIGGQFNSPGQGWPQWQVYAPVPNLAAGVWMHVAWTYDQNTMLIYVNGHPIATNVIGPHPIATSVSNLRISGDDNGNVMFDGLIDEVSIYNTALSSNEIAAIYGAGSAGKCVNQAAAITGQPLSQSVVLGGTATFSVQTTGLLPMTNQWELNRTNLSDNGRITGSQSNVLTIANVQFSDAGTYIVTLTNVAGGTVSQPATLAVLPKTPAVTWSNAAPITYGAALTGAQLNASANTPGTFAYTPPAGSLLSAGAWLLTAVFTPADTVDYNSVTNYASLTVSNAPLIVTAAGAARVYGQTNPAFTGTITGLQGADSITASYSCAAVPASPPGGYPVVPSLADPFGRLVNYSVTLNNGTLTISAAAPPSISIVSPGVGSTNGAQTVAITGTNFEVGATVSFGPAQAPVVNVSSPASLTVTTPASPPGVVSVSIRNPDGNSASLAGAFTYGIPPVIQAQPANQSVILGSNAQFAVEATGEGTLSYQWQFNGANLLNLGGISGVQTPALSISNLVTADTGSYQVVITNSFGALTSTSAVLTVLTLPTVSTPQSLAVGVGAGVSLSVTAGGTAPWAYQWYQGTTLLAGATNPVLNFPSVQTTNQGSYTVVVTNIVGGVTSAPAMLTVLGYCAAAQAAQTLYPAGTTIPFTVQTFNCGTQTAAGNSAAVLWIYNAGTSRTIPLTTGVSGSATVDFTPLAGEVGLAQYAAALPGVNNPAPQGSFTLLGMALSAPGLSTVLTVGLPQTNTLTLSNLTSVALSGLAASVLGAPANISVQVSVPATLPGNGSAQATYVMQAVGATPNQAQFTIEFTTAQGVTNDFPINASVVQLEPQLTAAPPSLSGTMVGGQQTFVSFSIANLGGAPSGSIQLLLPANAPWLSTVTLQPMASLAPGQTNLVTLALTPATNLALGAYPGSVVVACANSEVSVPFTFDCVSTQVGNLQVTAQDEFTLVSPGAPNVSNATVTVSDFLTGTNVATAVTGPTGIVVFSNLLSAYYNINVEATNHGGFGATVLVAPNQTTNVNAFLPVNLVSYTWVVTPTEIPDNYEFTLTTTFQTQVPWPVVTITPGAINLCGMSGSNQVDLVITNNGLISAQDLVLSFGSNENWSIVPLASNLGDLAAESSLVVPVILTQLGSSPSAASSIAAGLNWHVFTPTQSNYYTTPIFVYNANPNDCIISSAPVLNPPQPPGGGGEGGGGGGGGGGAGQGTPDQPYVATPSYSFAPPVTGAIVDVTLQIDQHAVIERNAFNATLQINNTAGSAISDLQVTINPVDASGNPASNLFAVLPPLLTGLNAVDGTGSMANGTSGTASWTIIPANGAAPAGPAHFAIGGTLSYVLDGQQVVIPLFAVPITVMPSPILNVDYFLQHDVYSQDPFVSQYEPPVPFGLGIIVHNDGLGLCDDFTITSAQPQIIANSNGLLISFQLIGSQAGTNQAVTPSLTMDLGAIQPESAATGVWLMTSSLEGAFISYTATFQEINALGATNISLVNSVAIHEMNHIVRITVPSDDGIPDFLVNDTTNIDALPDNVYSSTGPVFPVTSLTNVTVSGTLSPSQSSVTATLAVPAGFVYVEFPDPSAGTMTIGSVTRSDGVNLLVGPNVWQTPERDHMLPPQYQSLVHIFDYNSTGSYAIGYGPAVTAPTVTTLEGVSTNPAWATLNCLVNPDNGNTTVYYQWGATTNYTGVTPTVTLTESLNTPQDAAIVLDGLLPNTTYHCQAVAENSAGTSFGGDVTFATPLVSLPVIAQATNMTIGVGQYLAFVNQANAPVTYSLDPGAPAGAAITTNGIFTWSPSCEQGTTVNQIKIWANDIQYPTVSNSMTFQVTVGDCVQLSVGSAAVQSGQSVCVPVTLVNSSVPLGDLQFTLQFPTNRFTNWTISSTDIAVGAAILESSSASQAQFDVSALPGRSLQAPANIAQVCFQALGAHSGFVTLAMTNMQGTETNGALAGASTGAPGTVILVAAEPILLAAAGTNSMVMLTLYGNPGTNYVIQSSKSLSGNDWQTAMSATQTNLAWQFNVGNGGANPPARFFRAYQPSP
jgi:hypothetical protein